MSIAVQTLVAHGGGLLVVSGHNGEAERLAALAPDRTEVVLETEARSTLDNVSNSVELFLGSGPISIATDRFHRRRAIGYLGHVQPELLPRVVQPAYVWSKGWWMDLGGGVYALWLWARRTIVSRGERFKRTD